LLSHPRLQLYIHACELAKVQLARQQRSNLALSQRNRAWDRPGRLCHQAMMDIEGTCSIWRLTKLAPGPSQRRRGAGSEQSAACTRVRAIFRSHAEAHAASQRTPSGRSSDPRSRCSCYRSRRWRTTASRRGESSPCGFSMAKACSHDHSW